MILKPIARIENSLNGKFGTPRQSGLAPSLVSRIVLEPEYRDANALRGLEGFSHLWLIWGFHLNTKDAWSPTIRPPRLGGNERIGVFASRSPYRPNPIGLSSVVLERIEDGCLIVSGSDLVSGTPIYDIKPYLPFTDSHPDARAGYVETRPRETLEVCDPAGLLTRLPETDRTAVIELLAQDPRPAYQTSSALPYGLSYGKWDIRFRVDARKLTIESLGNENSKKVK